jgi:CheY-like chemotaxis protein
MTEEKKPKILLVDDDRFLLDIYALKFKASGLEIETFSSSKEAMNKLEAGEKYDIIILDIIMPGIDGMEMLKNIKQEKLCEGASVIMLTNQADEVEKAKALGVDGYIIKATTIPSEVVSTVLDIYKNKNTK